jgi:electron transport complex protein RnfE
VVLDDYPPFLLAILPPGAFIFTGLIIAIKNVIDARIERRAAAKRAPVEKGSRRVRVTGAVS